MSILTKIAALCTMVLFGEADEVRDYYNSLHPDSFADSTECHIRAAMLLNRLNKELDNLGVDRDDAKKIIDDTFVAVGLFVVFASPEDKISEKFKGIAYCRNSDDPTRLIRITGFVVNRGCKGKFMAASGKEVVEVYSNGKPLMPPKNFAIQVITAPSDHNFFDRNPNCSLLKRISQAEFDSAEYKEKFRQAAYCRAHDMDTIIELQPPDLDLFDRNPKEFGCSDAPSECKRTYRRRYRSGYDYMDSYTCHTPVNPNTEINNKILDYWLKSIRLGFEPYTLDDILLCTDPDLQSLMAQKYSFILPILMALSISFWRTKEGMKIMAQIANIDNYGYPGNIRWNKNPYVKTVIELITEMPQRPYDETRKKQYRIFELEEERKKMEIERYKRNRLIMPMEYIYFLANESDPMHV